jgi:hypothetical protein
MKGKRSYASELFPRIFKFIFKTFLITFAGLIKIYDWPYLGERCSRRLLKSKEMFFTQTSIHVHVLPPSP